MFTIKSMYLDQMWKRFKAKYEDAPATDQDAYYALSTVAYAEAVGLAKQSESANDAFEALRQKLSSKHSDPAAFNTAWYNDILISLKSQKDLAERARLAAQLAALTGNSPMSLAEQTGDFLEEIDKMIEDVETEFNTFLTENEIKDR